MNTANRGRNSKRLGAEMAKVTVNVNYAYIDGAHFFTSEDPKWVGLCAASADLAEAWEDVSVQLDNIAKLDHGASSPGFQPSETFNEFLNALTKQLEAEIARRSAAVASSGIRIAKARRHASAQLQRRKTASPVPADAEMPYIPPQVIAWKVAHAHS